MVDLVRFARAAPCTKPLLAFASMGLMIAFIFSTVIVTSGNKPSSKGLYIVSFNYDLPPPPASTSIRRRQADDEPTTTVQQTRSVTVSETLTTAPTSMTSAAVMPTQTPNLVIQEKFKNAVQALITDDNMNATIQFNEARVSYSGICVEVMSMEGIKGAQWLCGSVNTTEVLGATAGGDPFDLIGVAAYFKNKVAFALPWWVATACLGVAMLCQMVLMIPLLPIPPIVQRVTAVLALVGTIALLGGLVLQHVTANTVAALTHRLTIGTVDAHVGRMNQALGWSGFALALLASIAVGVVVAAEMALERGERMMDRAADMAASKIESKIPYGSPNQSRNFSGSSVNSGGSGLGRSIRDNGPDMLRGLAKAKTRGDALNAVVTPFSREKSSYPHGSNMV
ncbi:hypothetical protein DRE_01883 [Drechslerella stenobrocha 248]|uniref:Uncharacterized protein n=1 Tax=Drechslerella stenobrocha 248 TaxID=1043628 RepID=W7HWX0_9PEZI|nr:hypothetical protein DRE_01883 [Drechslerella stenobrocha 248]